MKRKIALKIIFIIVVAAVVLFSALIIILKLTWKPEVRVKETFSVADISVIKSELSIEGEFEISNVQFTHAKDSVFHIHADSDSLSILENSYIHNGSNYDNAEKYIHKDNDSIHCKAIKVNEKYEFEFIIYDYNEKLFDLMD